MGKAICERFETRPIAEKLGMKSAPNVCQQIRRFRRADETELPKKVREWKKLNIF